jgi:transposase
VCDSYYPGHVRGFRSLSATDDILTGSRMARLTAQQRSELLQGESIDAIVQQTGHARTTVLRWVRGFTVAGSLSDRTRSGRPVTVLTPTVVGRIKQLAKAKRGCRSRSTRQVAATLSSRGTLISQTSVCRALDSKGVKPYVQPQVPLQRYGDKLRGAHTGY